MITMSNGQDALEHIGCQRLRVGSKKSAQHGRSPSCGRSVYLVREHGKRARTPLAAFFNRPIIVRSTPNHSPDTTPATVYWLLIL